jgi:hypothetical protein
VPGCNRVGVGGAAVESTLRVGPRAPVTAL